jgi:hypothetical protein
MDLDVHRFLRYHRPHGIAGQKRRDQEQAVIAMPSMAAAKSTRARIPYGAS